MNRPARRISGFEGRSLASGDPGWDEERRAFNLTVDQRPALIAMPETPDDVAAALTHASRNGLDVAPQRTGHNAGPLGDLSDTILLKTNRLQKTEINRDARRASVGAGAVWADVVPSASEMGLAALHGSAPDVGVVGYTLGGGVGWYARRHGLACNMVSAIDAVTADGRKLRVDRDNEPELFWAMRGGGGSFAIATAIEFDLIPVESLYAGALFFPIDRAHEVLHTWNHLLPDLPEEITTVGRILRIPPFPEIPEPLRGNDFVLVEAVHLGNADSGAELLQPLRALGPTIDTFNEVPPVAISDLHMDPPEPSPAISGHALTARLPESAIDSIIAAVGPDSGSALLSFEMRHTEGALGSPIDGCGALACLEGSLMCFGVGIPGDPETASSLAADLQDLDSILADHKTGLYGNFTETTAANAEFFDPSCLAELGRIRSRYDPDSLIRANHPIEAA